MSDPKSQPQTLTEAVCEMQDQVRELGQEFLKTWPGRLISRYPLQVAIVCAVVILTACILGAFGVIEMHCR